MTVITNLTHDVITYLVTQCQNSASLGSANPMVGVFDGPIAAGEVAQVSQLRLWIGYDALTGAAEAGTATQKFSFLGGSGSFRDETGEITCTAEAWTGDTNPAVARASCKAIMGAVETMLRGAPTIGPGDTSMGGLVQWSQVEGPFTWTQSQSGTGFSAMCVFRVTYFARLHP